MIYVKGNGTLALSGGIAGGQFHELGLASEQVRITPNFRYRDVFTDNFGPDVPADVLWHLADVTIRLPLIHYDDRVLDAMISESMGGIRDEFVPGPGMGPTQRAGICAAAGTPMGGLIPLYLSGNHYFGLQLDGGQAISGRPWRFPACYLTGPPVEYPLGTQVTVPVLTVRAIPYRINQSELTLSGGQMIPNEVFSSGAPLWFRYSG